MGSGARLGCRGCRALGAGDSGRPGSGTADSEADFWPTRTLGRGRADVAKRGDLCWFSGGGASTSGALAVTPGAAAQPPAALAPASLGLRPLAWRPKPRRSPRLCQWASCRARDPLCGPTRAGRPHRSARRPSPASVPGVGLRCPHAQMLLGPRPPPPGASERGGAGRHFPLENPARGPVAHPSDTYAAPSPALRPREKPRQRRRGQQITPLSSETAPVSST